MADADDDPGYSETRGPSMFPANRRYENDLPDDDDDLADRIVRRTPFPGTMLATGVLWIAAGATYLAVFVLLRLVNAPFQTSGFLMILGAFFFIKDGIQLIRGVFRDPQFDGVVSILIGLFLLGKGWYRFVQADSTVELVVGVFFGVLFLAPGILVLIGRKQYLYWKSEQDAR